LVYGSVLVSQLFSNTTELGWNAENIVQYVPPSESKDVSKGIGMLQQNKKKTWLKFKQLIATKHDLIV